MAECRQKSANLYNHIIANISKAINFLKPEELTIVINSLSRANFKSEEFYDQIIGKLKSEYSFFNKYLKETYYSLFSLGHDTELAKEFVSQIIEKDNFNNSNSLVLALYASIFDFENLSEKLSKLINGPEVFKTYNRFINGNAIS